MYVHCNKRIRTETSIFKFQYVVILSNLYDIPRAGGGRAVGQLIETKTAPARQVFLTDTAPTLKSVADLRGGGGGV